MNNEVFAFEVWPVQRPEWAVIVNHRTAGKAKSDAHRDLTESWPDVPFTDMRVRKLGPPRTTQMFDHVAQLRGMPELRCGQRISFLTQGEKVSGVLVDVGGGANFGVLCDKDSIWPDLTVYVHPSEIVQEVLGEKDSPPEAER